MLGHEPDGGLRDRPNQPPSKGCEAHSSVILSHVDEEMFKKLGVNISLRAEVSGKEAVSQEVIQINQAAPVHPARRFYERCVDHRPRRGKERDIAQQITGAAEKANHSSGEPGNGQLRNI